MAFQTNGAVPRVAIRTNPSLQKAPGNARREGSRLWPPGRDLVLLGAILLIGSGLRVAYLNEARHAPDFDHPLLDAKFFDYWARGIAFDQWACPPGEPDPEIATTPYCRPPGYPFFLAAIYRVTDGSYLAVRVVQNAIGLASVALAFFLARRVFGRRAALIAAVLMATYWVFIFYDGELHSPNMNIFLLLALMYASARWLDSGSKGWALAIGSVSGVFALFRPESLAFVPLVMAWMAWARLKQGSRRALIFSLLLCGAGCALFVIPAVARNYRVSGEPVLCTSGGINFYACNNELANGIDPYCDLYKVLGLRVRLISNADFPQYVRALRKKLNNDTLTFSQTSQYFTRLAIDYIVHHPGHIARLMVKKALLFWGPVEVANEKELHYEKTFSPVLHYLPGFRYVAALFFCGVLAFVLRARTQGLARNTAMAWLMLAYIAVYFGLVLWFMAPARYRVPLIPLMILFGAFAASEFVEHLKRRNTKQAIVLAAAFGVFLVPLSFNFTSYTPRLFLWHTQRGLAFQARHDLKRAEEELRLAGPSVIDKLGNVLLQEGRNAEALACYQRVIESGHVAMPSDYVAMGCALMNLGQLDQAIERFHKALELDAASVPARMQLGLALIRKKAYAQAAEEFERIAQGSARADALHDLAWIEELQGHRAEAKAKYEKLLVEFPNYPESHNNLGNLLKQEGNVEAARAHFAAAIQANPNYVLARENMAILLRDTGDRSAAATEFREILRIDPGNRFAQRELALLGSS